jgi:starvation-inducible DNA-binding protein
MFNAPKYGFLTGRCKVSKAKNDTHKTDKISPDLDTPSDLPQAAVEKISASLNTLLADAFALYLKTKNFHWHVSGRNFRDYHLLLDEQSDAIFATTDQLAERVRKLGGATLRSIGDIAKHQTIKDNDEAYVPPREMLRELMEDNSIWRPRCARHTSSPMTMRTPARPACSKPSSTKPSGAPGFCSRPAVRKAATRLSPCVAAWGWVAARRRRARHPCSVRVKVGSRRFAHPAGDLHC